MPRDLYEILGVKSTASEESIKRAYRRLVKRYHPDVNKARGAKEMFLEVNEAYDVLSNPLLRREYDERVARERGWEPPRTPPRRGAPVKVRMPADYVRVASPFGFSSHRDRLSRTQDRQMEKRSRTARMVWRLYVVTVFSMSGTLAVLGGLAFAAGATFTAVITAIAAAMMLVLLLIAWLAKGMLAPEL